jgi:hypothetical protein
LNPSARRSPSPPTAPARSWRACAAERPTTTSGSSPCGAYYEEVGRTGLSSWMSGRVVGRD